MIKREHKKDLAGLLKSQSFLMLSKEYDLPIVLIYSLAKDTYVKNYIDR